MISYGNRRLTSGCERCEQTGKKINSNFDHVSIRNVFSILICMHFLQSRACSTGRKNVIVYPAQNLAISF